MTIAAARCAASIAVAFAGLLLAAAPADAQTQGPVANSAYVPAAGETRSLKLNEVTITSVYAGRNGSLDCWNLKSSNGSTGQSCNTTDGNFVSRQGTVGVNLQDNPHSGLLAFPLFVGKQYDSQFASTAGNEGARNQTRKVQVVAYEKVTVPAGTFDVFRIKSTRQAWGGTQTDRLGARYGRMSNSRFDVEEGVFYYAPTAGVVKFDEGTIHAELLSISPRR